MITELFLKLVSNFFELSYPNSSATDSRMMETTLLRFGSVPHVWQDSNLHHRSPTAFTVGCSYKRQDAIPKRGPFGPTPLERSLQQPSYVEKTKKDLSDYCMILEGEKSYSCWETWLDLNELESVAPRRDVESIISASGGMKSMIGRLHRSVELYKQLNDRAESAMPSARGLGKPSLSEKEPCPIPDGLPKSPQELQEEEEVRSQDSSYTRLLRAIGGYPSWYTPRPDHETD